MPALQERAAEALRQSRLMADENARLALVAALRDKLTIEITDEQIGKVNGVWTASVDGLWFRWAGVYQYPGHGTLRVLIPNWLKGPVWETVYSLEHLGGLLATTLVREVVIQ